MVPPTVLRLAPAWGAALAAICVASAPVARAQGLGGPPTGLGGPGGGLVKIDPKALAFEKALLDLINDHRARKKIEPLAMVTRLQMFARKEAELAARGDPSAAKINDRIRDQALAPFGYFVQTVFGETAPKVFAALRRDRTMGAALSAETPEVQSVGIGAFFVPVEKPYYQVVVLVTREADPMAGKPGLTKEQTDAVMNGALGRIKTCFDDALQRDPNLGGDLLFKIVIGGGGEVDDVTLLRSLGDAAFDGCALTVVRGLRFPTPYKGKPVTLNHPVRLTNPNMGRRLGKLTPGQINATFGRARAAFQRCYEDRLQARPKLAGTITLALTVMPDGSVRKVRAQEDTLGDEVLASCILEQARALAFPRPKLDGEVDVTYPLSFDPPTRRR